MMQQTLLENQINLRYYQQELKDRIYAELRNGKNKILAQLPTGGGKSKLMASIIRDILTKSKRVLFIAHRDFLLEQAKYHLVDGGIPEAWIGFIKAGYPEYLESPIQICSPQTWARRYEKWQKKPLANHQLSLALPDLSSASVLGNNQAIPFAGAVLGGFSGRKKNWQREDGLPQFDVIVIDEAHHSATATYEIFWELYPEAKILGFTATPCRGDGKGFDHLYESLVVGVSVKELIEQKFLSDYRLVRGKIKPNLKGLKTGDGEYVANDDAVSRFSTADILGDIVSTWKQFVEPLPNKRTVGFAVRCDHARNICAEFQAVGIKTDYIDGDFSPSERVEVLSKFILGEIDILWQFGLFGEGFDLGTYSQRYGLPQADIVAVQIARPVRSLALARQIYGRCLRPDNNKIAYVIDHGNVYDKCGFPCDEVEWTLEGSKLREAPKKECPECHQIILRSLEKCPFCKYEFPKRKKECPKCHSEVGEDLRICSCGYQFWDRQEQLIEHDKTVDMELVDPNSLDKFERILQKYSGTKALQEYLKKHRPSFGQLCEASKKVKAWDAVTGSPSPYWVDPWFVWFLWKEYQIDKGNLPEKMQIESWRGSLFKLIKDYNNQYGVQQWRESMQKSAKCRRPSTDWVEISYQEFKKAWEEKQLKLPLPEVI